MRVQYFYCDICVDLCEKICDDATEAYLHFITATGLKKHHTLTYDDTIARTRIVRRELVVHLYPYRYN